MSSSPKSVLVTGANRGIGLELVRQLAHLPSPPSYIFATYRSADAAKELLQLAVQKKNVRPLQFDVRDVTNAGQALVDSVTSVVGDRGLNLLINNAGVHIGGNDITDATHDQLMDTYEVNAVGPLLLTKALLPLLKLAAESGAGTGFTWSRSAIVNMSSLMGSIVDATSGGRYAYRMSKAAMNMSTKAMSVDLNNEGILVVSLNPGWVRTDMGSSSANMSAEESVRLMLDVLRSLTEESNAGFFNYNGKQLPY